MNDKVFASWLTRQYEEAMALASASDVLTIVPESGVSPPARYLVHVQCPTLIKSGTEVIETRGYGVAIQFPNDYLRAVPNPAQIIALLKPWDVFHPNVRPPFICLGHIGPGTGLRELVYQVYDIFSFRKLTPREDDALNHEACVWARQHMARFPLLAPPLRRRSVAFTISEVSRGAHA